MKEFLKELRRRGVAKAAAVYAVIAWALIESSSVIFPALQLPDWTVTFIVLLALFGFPITLVLAWVFDWTRQGIVRTPAQAELPHEQVTALRRGRFFDFAVIAVLLGVIVWLGWERAFDREPDAVAGVLDSIAVLPFVNMSGNPDHEYFGDGLAEELLNALVRIDGLRVAARTSSFEYKDQNVDIRRIGEALNVATVLEGSVRRAGDRVRVTAQLIRSDDGFHLWSDTYDASLEDIFAVQDRIALAIVDALRVQLGARERARITAHHTRDVEAFERYLRGRYEMNRRTASSLERAIDEFRAAIARDPEYAAAYSGLSDSWILRASYGGIGAAEATRNAEPLARRALALDPELAEAHASLGLVLRNKEQTAESVEPFLRAIELNPSYSPAYHWLALSYGHLGRLSEAVDLLRRAIEIDPQYVTGKRVLLGYLRDTGRDDEADAFAVRLASEHPDDPMLFYGLAGDAMAVGRRVDAMRHSVRALRLSPDNLSVRASASLLLLEIGDIERAGEQIEIIRGISEEHWAVASWPGNRALFVGDLETAQQEAEAYRMTLPAGFARDQYTCSMMLAAGRPDLSLPACRALLERAGWEPGGAIPPGLVDPAASMMLAAKEIGEHAVVDMLLPAFEAEFDRMEAAGLAARELRWARALIDAHSGRGTEDLIAVLPERLARGTWNLRIVDANPLFAPVRDDPRFQRIIAEAIARQAEDRAAIDRIDIPTL